MKQPLSISSERILCTSFQTTLCKHFISLIYPVIVFSTENIVLLILEDLIKSIIKRKQSTAFFMLNTNGEVMTTYFLSTFTKRLPLTH